ncbi:MAG: periplasmic heavy metal sensor [Gammaproteobacteria bacterium]|nr:periplasmic heavy metal sensor [Gammaproteobacteria bacterium]MDE2345563.1 periplasmic heavy metal sensor [Gammaproteobacteria bacterium]
MNLKGLLTITASVAAFTAATAFAAGGWHGPGGHGPGPFELFSPRVVQQLHLNSSQTQALDKIQAERKAQFTQMRTQHAAMMESMQAALKSGNPDMHALMKEMNANMDRMRDSMRQLQNQELGLYDTLTPQQKKIVSEALLKHMSYMGPQRDWKRGRPTPPASVSNSNPEI